MYYITVKQTPVVAQMTLEELLFGDPKKVYKQRHTRSIAGTKTVCVREIPTHFREAASVYHLIEILNNFNEKYEHLHVEDMSKLYYTFHIPKRHGGLRRIDAPHDELMTALRELKVIFEDEFGALYHTNAFAYIKKRSTIDAVKRHQSNESKWFAKYDLSNFFGSTTIEFVMQQLSLIYPFCLVMKEEAGARALRRAVELGFLNGGLPQGTPLSPTLTNIMMIPIDFWTTKKLRDVKNGDGQQEKFVYTRYADDYIISSRYGFDHNQIEEVICGVLDEFNAPFKINTSKTRYGNSNGRNWNLGVMLNKDNEITVGYKNKMQFKRMLSAYAFDKKHGTNWPLHDVQTLAGLRSYYRCVEKNSIDALVSHVDAKFGVNILEYIQSDLRNLTA